MSPRTQNMKTGADALGTAESVLPKTCPRAQNMKTGPEALGTAENESGHAKNENETLHPPYRRKRVREIKT
jgi:hypothetical protein